MPNRIIKETICTSETIDRLTPLEETAFYRLLVNCDDYGRMDGRASILKARLYPLKDIRTEQIDAIVRKLASVGLVSLYDVGGKPFIQTVNWDKHQQIRARRGKFPAPDNNGYHVISDDIKCWPNPIQSESNPNPNLESESESERARDGGEKPLLTDQEMDTAGQAYQSGMNDIEKMALSMTMRFGEIDRLTAERLMADYTAEWVLEAMRRAATGPDTARCWRYIEGVLKGFKRAGGPDKGTKPFAHVGKRVEAQNYTQRTYPEIDLGKWAEKAIKEAEHDGPTAPIGSR